MHLAWPNLTWRSDRQRDEGLPDQLRGEGSREEHFTRHPQGTMLWTARDQRGGEELSPFDTVRHEPLDIDTGVVLSADNVVAPAWTGQVFTNTKLIVHPLGTVPNRSWDAPYIAQGDVSAVHRRAFLTGSRREYTVPFATTPIRDHDHTCMQEEFRQRLAQHRLGDMMSAKIRKPSTA